MPGQKAYVSRRVWRLTLAADQHAPAQNDKSAFRRGVSFGGKKLPVCRSGFFQNLCLFNEVMYLPLGEGVRCAPQRSDKAYVKKLCDSNAFRIVPRVNFYKMGINIP